MLLRDDKEANARILVEHIIREDYTLESYEVWAEVYRACRGEYLFLKKACPSHLHCAEARLCCTVTQATH